MAYQPTRFISTLLAGLLAVGIAGCGGSDGGTEKPAAIGGIYSDPVADDGYVYSGGVKNPLFEQTQVPLGITATAKLRPMVKVLDVAAPVVTGDVLTFTVPPALSAGDVFIVDEGAYFALRVEGTRVQWAQPSLEDVFEHYDFRFEEALPPSPQSKVPRTKAAAASLPSCEGFVQALLGHQVASCRTIGYTSRVNLLKSKYTAPNVAWEVNTTVDALAQFTGHVANDGVTQTAAGTAKVYFLEQLDVPIAVKMPAITHDLLRNVPDVPLGAVGPFVFVLGPELKLYLEATARAGENKYKGLFSSAVAVGATFERQPDGQFTGAALAENKGFRVQPSFFEAPAVEDISSEVEFGIEGRASVGVTVLKNVAVLGKLSPSLKVGGVAKTNYNAKLTNAPSSFCTVVTPKVSLALVADLIEYGNDKFLLTAEHSLADVSMPAAATLKFGYCKEAASSVNAYMTGQPLLAGHPANAIANVVLRAPGDADAGHMDPSDPRAPTVRITHTLGDKSCSIAVKGNAVGAECLLTMPEKAGTYEAKVVASIDEPATSSREAWVETFSNTYEVTIKEPPRKRTVWTAVIGVGAPSLYGINDILVCAHMANKYGPFIPSTYQECAEEWTFYTPAGCWSENSFIVNCYSYAISKQYQQVERIFWGGAATEVEDLCQSGYFIIDIYDLSKVRGCTSWAGAVSRLVRFYRYQIR